MYMYRMKETYYYSLRHFLKQKKYDEYAKGVIEYQKFLNVYYEYDYYYNVNIDVIPKYIETQFTKEQILEIHIIKITPHLRALFKEFKYQKCDSIFMNAKFNEEVFDKCKDTIMDRETFMNKYDTDYMNIKSKQKTIDKIMDNYIVKSVIQFFKFNNTQFYALSIIIFIIALVALITPFYSE